jgi:chemotaxis protein MotB
MRTRMKRKPSLKFHAGGAWKVAYGDFVTGMMALFLVLWITTMKTDEVFATTRYFKDSYLFGYTPSDPIKQPETRTGSIVNQIIGYEESVLPNEEQPRDTIQYKVLEQMAMEFYKLLNQEADPNERVKIKIEQDSLRITLFDNDRYPLFTEQPGKFTNWGSTVMKHMAWLLDRHDMRTRIDAHTFKGDGDAFATTNLQAEMARKELIQYGLTPSKVEQITSYGDAVPNNPEKPAEKKNQRLEISIIFDKDDRLRPDLIP